MYCPTTSLAVPIMLYNFKKRIFHPITHRSPRREQQPALSQSESEVDASGSNSLEWINDHVGQQNASAETTYVPGCTCDFCAVRSATDHVAEHICTIPGSQSRCHASRSLPSFRSVMEVLYPPSHSRADSPFPDPPLYSRSDSLAYSAQWANPEVSPPISSMTNCIEETPLSCSLPDPLAHDPSLTGVPSQEITPRGVLLIEPNSPIIDFEGDAPEEPLPTYSRFDQSRPCFPRASDILGPYPPLSVLRQSAR